MEIEKTLAGILLLKPELIAEISGFVSEDDFTDNQAKQVFSLVKKRFAGGKPFDLVIAAQLMPDSVIYLSEAVEVIPINYRSYARHINETARKKRLLNGMKIIAASNLPVDDMLQDVSRLHGKEIKSGKKSYKISDVSERVDNHISDNFKRGSLPGISTGFDFLENNYIRYVPGHMWVITGFTSVGKSKILIEKCTRLPSARTIIISTEMTEIQLMARLYARGTGFNENIILSGRLQGGDAALLEKVKNNITNRKLDIIDDLSELSDIEALIQQRSMREKIGVVFLDYVQNCNIKGVPKRDQGPEMASRLQQLAKKTETCLVCFSQVSNSVGRGDIDQFEAKGAGEWAAVADVGVRLKRNSDDKQALMYDMQKGRHYQTVCKELRFSDNFTKINEF